MILADPYFRKIPGNKTIHNRDGLYKISECIFDMKALSNLRDEIIYILKISDDVNLIPAQEIFKRIERRDLVIIILFDIYFEILLINFTVLLNV